MGFLQFKKFASMNHTIQAFPIEFLSKNHWSRRVWVFVQEGLGISCSTPGHLGLVVTCKPRMDGACKCFITCIFEQNTKRNGQRIGKRRAEERMKRNLQKCQCIEVEHGKWKKRVRRTSWTRRKKGQTVAGFNLVPGPWLLVRAAAPPLRPCEACIL